MARKTPPLTDKQIKHFKPKDKEYVKTDGDGLQLRILPNGTKSWRLLYKNPETGERSSLYISTYPKISLANARKAAHEARELIALGIDPKKNRKQKQRQAQLDANGTLLKVASDWMEVKKSTISEDYAADVWRSLELHVFPSHANTPIKEITAPIMIDALMPLQAAGSLETLRRLCQRLNDIMTYAVNCGAIHSNTLQGIKAAFLKPRKKNMPTIPPSELPNLMRDIHKANIRVLTRYLIHFQLHTITRASEAAGARWEEINFEDRVWIVPAERMKMKREHRIPLSQHVIDLLNDIKPISSHREHIFPSDKNPLEHRSEQGANAAIKRMGYGGELVSHGMRSIASTAMNEHGFDPMLIEACLAHVDKNEVRRAYNRTDYLERRRELMEWWSTYIVDAQQKTIHA
ncbi:integrase domain-containing protein [Thaumasiovibrio subtropicus]|uniref:integrase domain-containing protein n=1 Tax=Thaumasiovibrio subtropicus TaxID=1891207 RepID=UPI000B35370E|nr:integrase domain-containing protein [Thaumasiovibrio subtropicus]